MTTTPRRIVLTCHPGGGKTTAADLTRRELGDRIVVVPEAATILFAGGFPAWPTRRHPRAPAPRGATVRVAAEVPG